MTKVRESAGVNRCRGRSPRNLIDEPSVVVSMRPITEPTDGRALVSQATVVVISSITDVG